MTRAEKYFHQRRIKHLHGSTDKNCSDGKMCALSATFVLGMQNKQAGYRAEERVRGESESWNLQAGTDTCICCRPVNLTAKLS